MAVAALLRDALKDLIAFLSDHVFAGVVHSPQEGFIHLGNLSFRRDDQDKVLDTIEDGLNFFITKSQFVFFQTDRLPDVTLQ